MVDPTKTRHHRRPRRHPHHQAPPDGWSQVPARTGPDHLQSLISEAHEQPNGARAFMLLRRFVVPRQQSGARAGQHTQFGQRDRIGDRERHPRPLARLAGERLRIEPRRQLARGLRSSSLALLNHTDFGSSCALADRVHTQQVHTSNPLHLIFVGSTIYYMWNRHGSGRTTGAGAW